MDTSVKFLLYLRKSWGLIGISFYLFCFALPLDALYSNIVICTLSVIAILTTKGLNVDNAKPILLTFWIFIGATVVSTVFSVDDLRSALIGLSLFPAAIVFYIVVDNVHSKQIASLFLGLALLSCCICGILLLSAMTSSADDPIRWMSGALFAFLSTPNDLIFVALMSPLTIALLLLSPSSIIKVIVVFSIVLSFVVIIVYRSNIAMLVLLVELSVLGVGLYRARFVPIIMTILVLIVIADSLQGFLLLGKLTSPIVWGNRMPLWLAARDMFSDAPLIGHGPGSFSILYEAFMHGQTLPEWVVRDPRHTPWVHNLYLELLAERGVLGLLAFAAIIAVILKYLSGIENGEARVYAIALKASVIGLLIAGVFELSILRHWVVIFISLLCALTVVLVNHDRYFEGNEQTFHEGF